MTTTYTSVSCAKLHYLDRLALIAKRVEEIRKGEVPLSTPIKLEPVKRDQINLN